MEEVSLDDFAVEELVSLDNFSSDGKKHTVNKFTYPILLVSYLMAPLCWGYVATFMGAMTLKEFFYTLADPVLYIFLALQIALPTITFFLYKKQVEEYKPSSEGEKHLNRCVLIFELASILLPVICALMLPFLYTSRYYARGLSWAAFLGKSPFFFMLIILTGITFVFSAFPYILFLQSVEHSISWLPYKAKYQTFSLVSRSVTIAIFVLTGMALIVFAAFLVPANRLLPDAQLVLRVFPVVTLCVVMDVFDFFISIRDVRMNVHAIAEQANQLSMRNYTSEPVPVTLRCELGDLINYMNSFSDTMSDLLIGFKNSIIVSNGNAKELSLNMDKALSSVMEITKNIQAVHSAMEEQAKGVQGANASANQIMGRIRDLNSSVELQSSAVSETSASVDEMVANIRRMTEVLHQNSQVVNSLGEASDEGRNSVRGAVKIARDIISQSASLMEASSVIQNIASQTNLLAMNAAIESAHAGEVGKGFAVVADEIRKLAEQSARQSKSIRDNLKGLSKAIRNVSDSTIEVQKKFDIIYNLAATVREQETVIMQAMNEQANGNQQVLDAMAEISEATLSVKDGSKEMLRGGEQVVQEMGVLNSVTEKIDKQMDSMTESIGMIKEAVQKVTESSTKNQIDLNSLGEIIGSFTLSKQ